jgi:hypothetical protein
MTQEYKEELEKYKLLFKKIRTFYYIRDELSAHTDYSAMDWLDSSANEFGISLDSDDIAVDADKADYVIEYMNFQKLHSSSDDSSDDSSDEDF